MNRPKSIWFSVLAGIARQKRDVALNSARDCQTLVRREKTAHVKTAHIEAFWGAVRRARSNHNDYVHWLRRAREEAERERLEASAEANYQAIRKMRGEMPRGTDPIYANFRAAIRQLSELSIMQKQAE